MAHAEMAFVRNGREVRLGCVCHYGRGDLDLVDKLARIQVAARRMGGSIVLRHPSRDLSELLALTGLAEVLPTELPP